MLVQNCDKGTPHLGATSGEWALFAPVFSSVFHSGPHEMLGKVDGGRGLTKPDSHQAEVRR